MRRTIRRLRRALFASLAALVMVLVSNPGTVPSPDAAPLDASGAVELTLDAVARNG